MSIKSLFFCGLLLSLSLSSAVAASLKDQRGQRLRRALPPNNVIPHQLDWDGVKPASHLEAFQHESVALSCQAGGSPPPTIHWLKNGKPISQDNYETTQLPLDESAVTGDDEASMAHLGISSTRSRLFLDCLTSQDTAIYTCVAENPYKRISTDTKLVVSTAMGSSGSNECRVEKRSKAMGFGKPARITMWTDKRLELSGADVRLFCRASGSPQPSITWERDGETGMQTIQNDYRHKILPNGDLIVHKVNFEDDMGVFFCVAQNSFGTDKSETFLYPTSL